MKFMFLGLVALVLVGCAEEPDYVNNRVLKDMTGCAFIARAGVGDTLFLRHSKELSDKSCEYKGENE